MVSTYVYLRIIFSGPIFTMVAAARARVTQGQGALARLERQCFHAHFQDPPTKTWLVDTLVCPTALYGAPFWGCDMPTSQWKKF